MTSSIARFSTTAIWNCRGSRSDAEAESRIRVDEARRIRGAERDREVEVAGREGPLDPGWAAEHEEGDEDPDGEEGDELDDRLERDRHHQPVLMLGRVRVARPEGDREAGEHQGDDEGEVAEDGARG